MLMLQPYISTAILLLCLFWSKNVLAKAGMQLQEKERIQANKLMTNTLPMQVSISIIFFAGMLFAGRQLGGEYSGWSAMGVSAIFIVLYIILNQRLYQRFVLLAYPNAFCRMYIQSRVIMAIGLLVFGHFLYGSIQYFSSK